MSQVSEIPFASLCHCTLDLEGPNWDQSAVAITPQERAVWDAARGFLPLGLNSGSGCLPHTPSYCGAGARGEWLQEEIKKSLGWCNAKQVTALPKTPCTSPAILSEKCWYQKLWSFTVLWWNFWNNRAYISIHTNSAVGDTSSHCHFGCVQHYKCHREDKSRLYKGCCNNLTGSKGTKCTRAAQLWWILNCDF